MHTKQLDFLVWINSWALGDSAEMPSESTPFSYPQHDYIIF